MSFAAGAVSAASRMVTSARCFHCTPAPVFGKLNNPNLDDILNPKLREKVAKQMRIKERRVLQARESKVCRSRVYRSICFVTVL